MVIKGATRNIQSLTKLANLYTVRNEMLGLSANPPQMAAYSQSDGPVQNQLGQYGDSDFLQAVAGKDSSAAWLVMDELMDTLRVVNPRAYESVMRKLKRI